MVRRAGNLLGVGYFLFELGTDKLARPHFAS